MSTTEVPAIVQRGREIFATRSRAEINALYAVPTVRRAKAALDNAYAALDRDFLHDTDHGREATARAVEEASIAFARAFVEAAEARS